MDHLKTFNKAYHDVTNKVFKSTITSFQTTTRPRVPTSQNMMTTNRKYKKSGQIIDYNSPIIMTAGFSNLFSSVTGLISLVSLLAVILLGAAFISTSATIYSRAHRRHHRLKTDLDELLDQIDLCHCDTFQDNTFAIFHAADPFRRGQFSAANITINTTRTFTWPDKNGTMGLISDIPVPITVFPDNEFVIFSSTDDTKDFMFVVNQITPGATRVFSWQDKDGTVALTSDVPIVTQIFVDDVFAIQNSIDNSKEIMFNVSLISEFTTRTYTWQNKNGAVALFDDVVELLINPTVFLDTVFRIQNAAETDREAQFIASSISSCVTVQYIFPNKNGTLALKANTGPVFTDDIFTIVNNVDTDKKAMFDASAISSTELLPPVGLLLFTLP